MTKDNNGYLVFYIFSKSYLRGGWMIKDANGYLILENFTKSYLWGGQRTKNAYELLVSKVALVQPMGWTDDPGNRQVPRVKPCKGLPTK